MPRLLCRILLKIERIITMRMSIMTVTFVVTNPMTLLLPAHKYRVIRPTVKWIRSLIKWTKNFVTWNLHDKEVIFEQNYGKPCSLEIKYLNEDLYILVSELFPCNLIYEIETRYPNALYHHITNILKNTKKITNKNTIHKFT